MTRSTRTIISANALGAVALFVALGGTSVAQTAVRAITGADVRNGSLTGRDVRDRSITRADLAPSARRAGPAGPAGPAGTRGPAGARGPAGERGPAGPDLAGATHVRVRGDRTPTQNGEALLAAVASITDASADRPYVIQLAPGTYELGGAALAMKPDVSIAGAGATATRITGDPDQAGLGEAVVVGADRTLLRDVTVTHRATSAGGHHTAMAVAARTAMRIEDAVLETGSGGRAQALLVAGGSFVDVRDSRLAADGAIPSAAIVLGSELRIRGSELVAAGASAAYALATSNAAVVVEHSALVSTDVAVSAKGLGTPTVAGSRVTGDVEGALACVGSYNGSFAALNGSCS